MQQATTILFAPLTLIFAVFCPPTPCTHFCFLGQSWIWTVAAATAAAAAVAAVAMVGVAQVIYCYEAQIEATARGSGLGKHLMQVWR